MLPALRTDCEKRPMHDSVIRIDPPLYVARTMISCWRCRAHMPAITLVAPNVPEADGKICILSQVEELPEVVLKFVRNRFPSFRLKYSKTVGSRYYASTCPKFGVISGDFHHIGPQSLFQAGPYRAIPRGLISGYTARANIGIHCWPYSTPGRRLTQSEKVVDSWPDFGVFDM